MAKFQMIESGVVYGNEMSRLLWSPNLRLSTARRTPRTLYSMKFESPDPTNLP